MGRFVNGDNALVLGIREKTLDFDLFSYCENDSISGYDPLGLYNRKKAISYAKKWYNSRNKQYYSYSQDCANFVSQCLYSGGINMTSSWYSYRSFSLKKHLWDPRSIISYKFWYDWDVSESWRLAKKQYEYFKSKNNNYINGGVITISKPSAIKYVANKCGVQKGDLLYFAGKKGDSIHHATMIAKVSDGKIYYTAHTQSRWEHNLAKAMGSEQVIVVKIKNDAS